MQRKAVGLHTAITACLTHALVDHHPERRRGEDAALAIAALLCRALLIVDVNGDAVDGAQLLLSLDDRVAVHDLNTAGQADAAVLRGVVGGDGDVLDTLSHQHLGHLRHRPQTGGILTTGHRHGRVVEDLERHGGAGGDRGLDGKLPTVEVGAIAHVLEEVGVFDERRGADPLSAFATHLGDTGDVAGLLARDDADHAVTADAGADERTLGHEQAGVVWASRAEERRADRLDTEGNPYWIRLANRGELIDGNAQCQHASQRIDEIVDRQRAVVGDQRLAIVVDLADDSRRICRAIQHGTNP